MTHVPQLVQSALTRVFTRDRVDLDVFHIIGYYSKTYKLYETVKKMEIFENLGGTLPLNTNIPVLSHLYHLLMTERD